MTTSVADVKASAAEGTVYDLGYAPHEGPRLGRRAAIRAMFVDGTRRALGLRRKPATKASGKLEKDAARGRSDEPQPKENIQDAERKKLDEIIRKENHKTSGNK